MSFLYSSRQFLDYVQDAIKLLERWDQAENQYLIYGAGIHTVELFKHLHIKKNTSFAGFIDQSLLKQTNGLIGYPVYSPQKATTLGIKAVLISSCEYQEQIKRFLEKNFKAVEIGALYPVQHNAPTPQELFLTEKSNKEPEKKRIAVVDTFFSWPPIGGSSVDLAMVMNHMLQKKYDVTFFLPRVDDALYSSRGRINSKEKIEFNIVHIPFQSAELTHETFVQKLANEIEEFQPEYLFLGDMYAFKPYLAERLKEYKVIWRSYNYDLVCPRMNLINSNQQICTHSFLANPQKCQQCISEDPTIDHDHPIFREIKQADIFSDQYTDLLKKTLRRAHTIVIYNNILGDKVKECFGALPSIKKIPTGVDLNDFVCKEKKGRQKDEVTIFFPGRVEDPAKGFEYFKDIFLTLKSKHPEIRLICTGKFDPGINGITSTGWIPREKIWDLYHSVDICVVPSLWEEPFGIVTLEAMGCGLAVVASEVGGIKQTMIHGETGFLVPPENQAEFCTALEKLIVDPNLRTQMGENGKKRVKQYSKEKVMSMYNDVFN